MYQARTAAPRWPPALRRRASALPRRAGPRLPHATAGRDWPPRRTHHVQSAARADRARRHGDARRTEATATGAATADRQPCAQVAAWLCAVPSRALEGLSTREARTFPARARPG